MRPRAQSGNRASWGDVHAIAGGVNAQQENQDGTDSAQAQPGDEPMCHYLRQHDEFERERHQRECL